MAAHPRFRTVLHRRYAQIPRSQSIVHLPMRGGGGKFLQQFIEHHAVASIFVVQWGRRNGGGSGMNCARWAACRAVCGDGPEIGGGLCAVVGWVGHMIGMN